MKIYKTYIKFTNRIDKAFKKIGREKSEGHFGLSQNVYVILFFKVYLAIFRIRNLVFVPSRLLEGREKEEVGLRRASRKIKLKKETT